MPYKITYTERFLKHYQTLNGKEKKQLKNKIVFLVANPLHPSLRTKRLKGTKDLYECSVNMDIRIIWYFEGTEMIILLDVGHHDILEKY